MNCCFRIAITFFTNILWIEIQLCVFFYINFSRMTLSETLAKNSKKLLNFSFYFNGSFYFIMWMMWINIHCQMSLEVLLILLDIAWYITTNFGIVLLQHCRTFCLYHEQLTKFFFESILNDSSWNYGIVSYLTYWDLKGHLLISEKS